MLSSGNVWLVVVHAEHAHLFWVLGDDESAPGPHTIYPHDHKMIDHNPVLASAGRWFRAEDRYSHLCGWDGSSVQPAGVQIDGSGLPGPRSAQPIDPGRFARVSRWAARLAWTPYRHFRVVRPVAFALIHGCSGNSSSVIDAVEPGGYFFLRHPRRCTSRL
ncbi:MAG TPA: hypothetical protein VKA15_04410 [Isosphaeraceae bacterium]|nr:hypothetical protein [Isosphaeraceae bacterium]